MRFLVFICRCSCDMWVSLQNYSVEMNENVCHTKDGAVLLRAQTTFILTGECHFFTQVRAALHGELPAFYNREV